jgi:enamine deaminase RidA (YjgF/YER057c/UK114 family)
MRKSLIDPEIGDELLDSSDPVDELAYSGGVVVQAPGHKQVYLSGIASDDESDGDDVAAQTRTVFEKIERYLAEAGGEMRDVVRLRIYVREPELDDEMLFEVHEIRHEFFTEEYPASTVVEVSDLVREHALIEVEADVIIPDDGWEVAPADGD